MSDATNEQPDNPAAVIGHNRPPVPTVAEIREILQGSTADMRSRIHELQAEVVARTRPIGSDEELATAADAYKELNAARKSWETMREGEKEPFLHGGRAVDGFFVPIRDAIDKALAELNKKTTAYSVEKERQARAAREAEASRLREEAERAAREAREAREREEAERRRQEEARAAADQGGPSVRFVPPTNEVRAAQQAADDAARAASRAERAAEAKAADLARTRGANSLSTLQEVWRFEIEDADAIPLNDLRPYIKREHIEQALGRYVQQNKDQRPLAGVRFYSDREGRIR